MGKPATIVLLKKENPCILSPNTRISWIKSL